MTDDKKVKAIYTMVENEIAASEIAYTAAFKAALDCRYGIYQKDPSIVVTAIEGRRCIQKKN